eukprot:TRINITY_DN2267_c0_g1_i1.p1 TRINITY_DN2267_c0_g1~~TRINITY_DN2267_c0_g1_i1.p1  ORF type:complete len:563 (-),score=139.52 TRINITY_DN2267_c0_g1_i1:26-1672(-)
MEAIKALYKDLSSGGTQLNKEGTMTFLSTIYDLFDMDLFEMMTFKSKGETIKEWWDLLDNSEVLTWEHFEKNCKPIIESLPAKPDLTSVEKDEKTGKYKLVRSASKGRLRSVSSGKLFRTNVAEKVEVPVVPSTELIRTFQPYVEKVWELALAARDVNEEFARPWFPSVPVAISWINNIIGAKGKSIADFEDGFLDGLALIHLLEVLSGVDLKGYVPAPANHVDYYKNIRLGLKFATHFQIDIHPVQPDDVHYGNFEKLIVFIYHVAQKWVTANIEDRKGKVAATPLVQANSVELKVDQKEQDEIYRLSSLAQQTVRPGKRYFVSDEKVTETKKVTVASNVVIIDMGELGKEEIPYQQTKPLGEVLQALCAKHNIADIDSYIATTLNGSELFHDSLLGEIPKTLFFLPAEVEKTAGTLDDLINASDKKAKQRLRQIPIIQRNYEDEDEDERESRRRQLQRAFAFEKVIDDSVSNIALEGMRKEYEKLMETLQLDKIKEQAANRPKPKNVSKIQDVDLSNLDAMVNSLDSFQKAYGTSETARDFFAGLI